MEREVRYIVIKLKDAQEVLSEEGFSTLHGIVSSIAAYRTRIGKRPLNCVVIEDDWPEYEPVWKMIERRVDGEQARIAGLKVCDGCGKGTKRPSHGPSGIILCEECEPLSRYRLTWGDGVTRTVEAVSLREAILICQKGSPASVAMMGPKK